jgi:hypothetical protein
VTDSSGSRWYFPVFEGLYDAKHVKQMGMTRSVVVFGSLPGPTGPMLRVLSSAKGAMMPRIKYDLNGTHYSSQAALEREVKAHIKASPRDRVFHDDLFMAVVNTLHPDVLASGERSSGDFEILTWFEQSRRKMKTSVDYRGGIVIMTFFQKCRRWLDVTLFPWRKLSNRQVVIQALRIKIAPVIPKPTTQNHCAHPGCDAQWHDLEYHHQDPTFAQMVEQAMLLVSQGQIDSRFDYNKFTPGTYSVADFIPSHHPAVIHLIHAHTLAHGEFLCPLHHRGER